MDEKGTKRGMKGGDLRDEACCMRYNFVYVNNTNRQIVD